MTTYILKAIEWRIIAGLITIVIAFFIVGEFRLALEVGAIDFLIKTIGLAIWLKYRN